MYNNSKIAKAIRLAVMFGAAATVSIPVIIENTLFSNKSVDF